VFDHGYRYGGDGVLPALANVQVCRDAAAQHVAACERQAARREVEIDLVGIRAGDDGYLQVIGDGDLCLLVDGADHQDGAARGEVSAAVVYACQIRAALLADEEVEYVGVQVHRTHGIRIGPLGVQDGPQGYGLTGLVCRTAAVRFRVPLLEVVILLLEEALLHGRHLRVVMGQPVVRGSAVAFVAHHIG